MTYQLSINTIYVLTGASLFGISAGVLGCFALLRRRALVGDALSHAALPGVCLAFMLSGGIKNPFYFLLGATISGLAGSLSIDAIVKNSRIKEDTAIGLILSVFFGVGILLLTHIQHQSYGNQSGLDMFLFGQAAAMLSNDVKLFSALALLLLAAVGLIYKEFKLIAFDSDFAQSIGLPVRWLDFSLTLLLVLIVTAGLQAVGVVLMAAMLITPPAAARQWTDRLPIMILLSGLFGGVAGASGALISSLAPRMPTGPWIVVVATAFFAVSIALAPRRGMIPRFYRHWSNARSIKLENILRTLYRLKEDDAHSAPVLDLLLRYRKLSRREAIKLLKVLTCKDLVIKGTAPGSWRLSGTGEKEARRLVRRHRLWEVYLTEYLGMGKSSVHADAEEIEHVLTPELEAELEIMLNRPTHDPHNRVIPYDEPYELLPNPKVSK